MSSAFGLLKTSIEVG